MGILKNFEGDEYEKEYVNVAIDTDLVPHIDSLSESSSSNSDDETHEQLLAPTVVEPERSPPATTRIAKKKTLLSKLPKPTLHVKSLGGKRSQGNRQVRRQENMFYLLNLAKDLDEDFAEVTINDLVETTISVFAQLLLNKNQMKVWNEFNELPEHQQQRFIRLLNKTKSKRARIASPRRSESNVDNFVLVEDPMDELNRSSGKDQEEICFHRIDSNIRSTLKNLLKRDHLPMDRIISFEDDLIPFFCEHPDSIYLRNLNHGFDRMLLHAVCQYFNLISKSSTRDGQRYTQVENRQVHFQSSILRLSNYLKRIRTMTNI